MRVAVMTKEAVLSGRLTNHAVHGRTRAFTYDFTGRMTTLTDTNGSVFAYEFDGEGNRLSQSLNDCLSKRFVYAGADVLLALTPANAVTYAWVNGPGIDQPIERLLYIDGEPRARRVFHSDAIGSIAALTDPAGHVTQSYAYSAFGTLRSSSGPDLNRVTYTAREHLGDSQGWMYYRHRMYNPHIGRFVSKDPLSFADCPNFYLYVHLAPLQRTDPWGLQCPFSVLRQNIGPEMQRIAQNGPVAANVQPPNSRPISGGRRKAILANFQLRRACRQAHSSRRGLIFRDEFHGPHSHLLSYGNQGLGRPAAWGQNFPLASPKSGYPAFERNAMGSS